MNPLNFLSGWKTFAGGLGIVGLGVFEITQGNLEGGIQRIAEGLALIGLGHKLDKAGAGK